MPQPPLSSLRQTALNAAEKRAQLGSLLPSGPKRLGGDRSIMVDLSPIQAAAMAAERRLQDDLWCGSQSSGNGEKGSEILEEFVDMEQSMGNVKISGGPNAKVSDPISRKRSRESHVNLESNIVELDASTTTSERMLNHDGRTWKSCKSYNTLVSQSNCNSGSGFVELSSASSSASVCNNEATHSPEEPAMWDCEACTFLNHVSVLNYDNSLFKHISILISLFRYIMKMSAVRFLFLMLCSASVNSLKGKRI